MELGKTMEEAIEKKDVKRIYSSFYTILLYDPGFKTGKFDEALQYVKNQNIPGFIQEYNGKPFKDKEEWTEEYWDELVSELMDNFCMERINMIKRMSSVLYPKQEEVEDKGTEMEVVQKKTPNQKNTVYQKTNSNGMLAFTIVVIIIILIIILVCVI